MADRHGYDATTRKRLKALENVGDEADCAPPLLPVLDATVVELRIAGSEAGPRQQVEQAGGG